MIFRKKKKEAEVVSFKLKVEEFWDWFSANAVSMYEQIEAGNCSDLQPAVSEQVVKLGGFAWVFGPGSEAKGGHSFTLTPEGNQFRAQLIDYWLKKSPKIEDWTFYGSKQASRSVEGMKLQIGGNEMTTREFWVVAMPAEDSEKIHLRVWHHLFEELEESDRYQISFIWLDECLGEFAVENQIGQIEISNAGLDEAFPIHELHEVVDEIWDRKGWKIPDPSNNYFGLKIGEGALPKSVFRSDCFYITTCLCSLQESYIESQGKMEHPTPEIGVDYLFIRLPNANFESSEMVAQRATIEDAIEAELISIGAGKILGGASGINFTYIDILSFSIDEVLPIISRALKDSPYGNNAELRFFDKDRIMAQLPL